MVTRPKFNDSFLSKLPPHDPNSRSKSKSYSDPDCPGLRAEKSKSNLVTFFHSITRNQVKHTTRLGTFPELKVKEARAMVARIVAEIDKEGLPQFLQKQNHAAMLLRDYAKQYLEFAFKYKLTAKDDESKLRLHIIPIFGDKEMAAITRKDIEMYCNDMRISHCAATGNRHLSLIARMFNKAVEWSIVEKNPAHGIKKYKENNTKVDNLSPEQITALFEAMEGEDNWVAVLAIKMLFYTGLRKNEVLHARWADVDFSKKLLFLPKTKAGRSRYVPLSDLAWEVILELKDKADGDFIFPGKDPSLPYHNLLKPYKRFLQKAGLPEFRLHSARHSFASCLVENGASLFSVQNLLGHASPQMTQRYSHINSGFLREASQLMNTALQKKQAP